MPHEHWFVFRGREISLVTPTRNRLVKTGSGSFGAMRSLRLLALLGSGLCSEFYILSTLYRGPTWSTRRVALLSLKSSRTFDGVILPFTSPASVIPPRSPRGLRRLGARPPSTFRLGLCSDVYLSASYRHASAVLAHQNSWGHNIQSFTIARTCHVIMTLRDAERAPSINNQVAQKDQHGTIAYAHGSRYRHA